MATVTTLRPSSTSSGTGWSADPAGTLHGVTSDDSDVTAAVWSGAGSAMLLSTPASSPPAGEKRHLVRLRVRGEDGSAWWAVRTAAGTTIAGSAGSFGASPEEIAGAWQGGVPATGYTTLSCYVSGQTIGFRAVELYLDVDTRANPSFTPVVLDGSGTPTVTVSDTATPTILASAVNWDGLPARRYRYWVTQSGATVWDTGSTWGTPVGRQTTPLDNGTYTAYLQIWSTLGEDTSYASDIEEITFDVTVGVTPSPDAPEVTEDLPFYRVRACAPDVSDLDNYSGYLEIQRVDCPRSGYLDLPGSTGAYAATPDSTDTTGDLEVTVLASRDDGWWPDANDTFASKYSTVGNQRGWRLNLDSTGGGNPALIGRPALWWSVDGVATITEYATARAPVDPYGRVHLRAFLDVDNGAGGYTVVFETVDGDGNWVQLGDAIVGAAPTSIFVNTAELAAGAYLGSTGPLNRWTGRIHTLQVREGRAGTILASVDFTDHPAGTDIFDDDTGNTWTVYSPAALTSEQQATSLAMLGPLAPGECAEWVDYTMPRTGVGASCAYTPESCCSYYRARTIGRLDGSIVVSAWSDAYDPSLSRNLVFAWPGTESSIPAGWDRIDDLDGLYLKGVPDAGTNPGTAGGAATHSHSAPSHTHSLNHSHTVSSDTGVSDDVLTAEHDPVGSTRVPALGHTHTVPTTGTAAVTSGSRTPGTSAVANDPDHLDVVWISPDNATGVPNGALSFMGDIAPTGWDTYANATGRYLKGAATGVGGGSTAAGVLAAHTHTINSHTHAGKSHDHTVANTGSTASTVAAKTGGNSTLWAASHNHPVTTYSASTASLASASGGASGTATPAGPPYLDLRVRQNATGAPDLPVGVIAGWRGTLATIPDAWQLCDGTSGTPNMFGRYPRGATAGIGGTGGSAATHTHTSPTHTHTTSGHAHGLSINASTASVDYIKAGTINVVTNAHDHPSTGTDSTTPAVGSGGSGNLSSTGTEPPYEEVAFVQLMETPEPPENPPTYCLVWDDDEHLIRTYGPDGPMYAPVYGVFQWTIDRPYTSAVGVNGTRFVTSALPGGRNLRLTAAVESEADLATLRAVLARPLVLISPSDSAEVWAAPVAESVRVVKVGRIRQIDVEFVATGPEPAPQLADLGV